MQPLNADHEHILGVLASRGVVSSAALQEATGKSQPTVSRLVGELSSRVLVLGSARATRYALPKSIHGRSAQQPVWWTSESGERSRIGTLSFLGDDSVHIASPLISSLTRGALPWFLSPLQAQGFLGRLHAKRLADLVAIDPDPQRWTVESVLLSALELQDGAGALTLGDRGPRQFGLAELPQDAAGLPARLDELALDMARTLPAGSSAGGEQPKFLARRASGAHVLVKFTPPKGTSFGDRWSDLLRAEALANRVLARHGVTVADNTIVESTTRTYLVSERFDRVGRQGRRHVVSVGAAHGAFVADRYANWARTCESLARQRRLPALEAERAAALLHFGRLIGNSDMHSGNLGLFVEAQDLAKGRFTLAPVYDMLPMRWRPDPLLGGAPDYAAFDPDETALATGAAAPAHAFWAALAQQPDVSRALRTVAAEMARRIVSARFQA